MSGTSPIPSLAGFISFAQNNAGVTSLILDPSSVYFAWAYDSAIDIVSPDISCDSPIQYLIAVYNLATHILFKITPDMGVANVGVFGSSAYGNCVYGPTASMVQNKFFSAFRSQAVMEGFLAGVISSSGGDGGSQSIDVPETLKRLSMRELDYMKTTFGRQYLEIAMGTGTLWGIS